MEQTEPKYKVGQTVKVAVNGEYRNITISERGINSSNEIYYYGIDDKDKSDHYILESDLAPIENKEVSKESGEVKYFTEEDITGLLHDNDVIQAIIDQNAGKVPLGTVHRVVTKFLENTVLGGSGSDSALVSTRPSSKSNSVEQK